MAADRLSQELARARRDIERYVDETARREVARLEQRIKLGQLFVKHAHQHKIGGTDRIQTDGNPSTVIVQENDVNVDTAAATLDFGTGFDVTSSPAGEANIALDLSEISAGGELAGTLDAPTVDATHAGSTHAAATTTHEAAADPHPGYVLESLLDAKGDLIAASAADTPAKLTVGANNKVLLAASGEAAGLKYDYVYDELTLTVETPTATENIVMRQFTQAVTIVAIQAVVIGGTSVTIDPEHGSTITTATKLLSAPEVVASASTSGEHIGGTGTAMAASFNDATLAAGDFLRLETTAISGTPTQLSVTIKYRLT